MTATKVLICGSRNWKGDRSQIAAFVSKLPTDAIIITGGAKGVDRIAESCAKYYGHQVVIYPPNWSQHGKSAGPVRNQLMVDACDIGAAFWDGESSGTADTIRRMKVAKKPIQVFVTEK